jgi:hypothetical protein
VKLTDIDGQLEYWDAEIRNAKNRNKILLTREWAIGTDAVPGVYAIFKGETLLYVGETGCLSKRLNDLRSTYNHSFRRSYGKDIFAGRRGVSQVSSRRRFPDKIELLVNEELQKLSICVLPIEFGRKEVEEYIIGRTPRSKPTYNAKGRRQ